MDHLGMRKKWKADSFNSQLETTPCLEWIISESYSLTAYNIARE